MSLSPAIYSFEEGSVFNEDVKIIYRDYGPKDAEPILLVQGLGGQLINWPDHLIDFLISKKTKKNSSINKKIFEINKY